MEGLLGGFAGGNGCGLDGKPRTSGRWQPIVGKKEALADRRGFSRKRNADGVANAKNLRRSVWTAGTHHTTTRENLHWCDDSMANHGPSMRAARKPCCETFAKRPLSDMVSFRRTASVFRRVLRFANYEVHRRFL